MLDLRAEAEAAAARRSCPRVCDYLTDERLQCLIDEWGAAAELELEPAVKRRRAAGVGGLATE